MSVIVAVALVASWSSAMWRYHRSMGAPSVEGLVLVSTAWLCGLGIGATLLAVAGLFGPLSMSVLAGMGALATWPWGQGLPTRRLPRSPPPRGWQRVLPWVVVVVGLALRWPVMDYPLAGRDQGTYTLRAQHTLRQGSLHAIDPVLVAAAGQARTRSGPADLLGLYHQHTGPGRTNHYEAAYRPGFYLADVEGGRVVPQFMHVHPVLMAVTGLVRGPQRVAEVMLVYAALSLLAMLALARRLWPEGVWAGLVALVWACAPLSIWVLRTPLSEGLASVLMLSATLAVLRARDEGPSWLLLAAVSMGTLAWVRGNGWLAAPVMLAAQWIIPSRMQGARRAGRWLATLVGMGVLVHAPTTFPYLYDELLRQLPMPFTPTPARLVAVMAVGLMGWWAVDRFGPQRGHEDRWLPRVFHYAPGALALALVAAAVVYLALRGEPLARPFSRLDPLVPLVGVPALGLAAVGLATVVRRWPRAPSGVHAWMLGLAGVLVATVALYAPRNLPQMGLYYYGRYLVPELMPAVLLLAVEGLRTLHRTLSGASPSGGRVLLATLSTVAGGAVLGWTVAGVLARAPVTRLAEFAGADQVVDHLAARIEPEAVVIAGGEGWHHGHTFNQVGGALAFRHGISVLPFHTREAAYASLVELLQEGPAASEQPPPPVYLLLNEATKHRMRDADGSGAKVRVSAIDDLLPPPFVARRVDLVEMLLDRLTPVSDGPPTRVTRDGLRMALMRVEVDPQRLDQVETWRLSTKGRTWVVDGPPGLEPSGGSPRSVEARGGAPCLGWTPLTLTLPAAGGAGPGPVELVLVATPGTAIHNEQWRGEGDGREVALAPPHTTSRRRDTLGPIALAQRPREVVVHGSATELPGALCPRGGLAQVRLLGPEAPMLHAAETSAQTFAPARSLGHPVTPVAWVSGRGVSRYRAGIEPTPEIEGLSLRVEPDQPLRFPPTALPDGGDETIEVVVTLTATSVGPSARLWVTIDGQMLAPIDPPDDRHGSWQSAAQWLIPQRPVATIEVELRGASPGQFVLLRDIGLFSRAAPIPGRLVEHEGGILGP